MEIAVDKESAYNKIRNQEYKYSTFRVLIDETKVDQHFETI